MPYTTSQPNRLSGSLALIALLLIIFSAQFSCKKLPEDHFKVKLEGAQISSSPNNNCDLNITVCEDCDFQNQIDNDTATYLTGLGNFYNNPYSLVNMTLAYNNIYTPDISSVQSSHYYVRFKPSNIDEWEVLESIDDLVLYDYPLDRFVIQEGEYWPLAYNNLGENELPWLYSVVDKNFSFPQGIQKEIIENLYIPSENDVLEDEAYYITGNMDCDTMAYLSLREERKQYYQANLVDPCQMGITDCGGGGGDTGGGGTPQSSPRKPSGNLTFKAYATPITNNIISADQQPIRYTRIVARRFLKIEKTYTDNNGNFAFKKNFPKKVTLIVKSRLSVDKGKHTVREDKHFLGAWKHMFPIKKNIGTYKGNDLRNINYSFEKGVTALKRKTRLWMAAVVLNTALETQDFFIQNNLTSQHTKLRFYLANPKDEVDYGIVPTEFDFVRRSLAPMESQERTFGNSCLTYLGYVGVSPALGFIFSAGNFYVFPFTTLFAYLAIMPNYPDIRLYYNVVDMNSITASKVTMSVAQQLGVAYLHRLADQSNLQNNRFEYYLLARSAGSGFTNTFNDYAPFGQRNQQGTDANPQLIALWQCLAQHLSHTISNKVYGNSASSFTLQGALWESDNVKSSNEKFLEGFNPNVPEPADYFSWIPVGLVNDLIDSNNETFPVIDNVSGFTYLEIQSALLTEPGTLLEFKNALISIKPSQTSQINQLFTGYGY